MKWREVISRWRSLPETERARIRRSRIPRQVALSMTFEGEPVDQRMLEAELARRTPPPAMSKRPSGA
jgi:hypothetical protein